jgi:hypothetical protein
MTRARPSLLLPLLAIVALAIAACQTQRKPIMGYDKPPPGILLDGNEVNVVLLWPIFDLPLEPEMFRPRFNGQDAVIQTSNEGFYDYAETQLQGWTGGWDLWLNGIPSGTYTVELVDSAGQSYGHSAPLAVPAGIGSNQSGQFPAVMFTHFDGHADSWTIDPTMQDSDPATDEITVTNLAAENVVVERCLIAATVQSSCTPVGTVAPGADLRTVETFAGSSMGNHQALVLHLASDASHSYERDLVPGSADVGFRSIGGSCQMERILVHGMRPSSFYSPTGSTSFAISSCYGYGSGGT